jgi:selenocysteine lyase/cysteine desulfurase
VLIDGAHALGMLPLDLRQLGADYFVANCHKWLSGPRGSAMLHVQPKHQRHVHPVIVSHGAMLSAARCTGRAAPCASARLPPVAVAAS